MKKLLLGWLAVFVTISVSNYVIHNLILGSTYEQIKEVFRPDMMDKMWIISLVTAIQSFFLVLIFSKGYRGTGIFEGVRFGFYAGFLVATGMAYGSYATYAIPYPLAMQWFVYGVAQYLLSGVVAAIVYGKSSSPAAS
ncbi:MAG: hypothetical protein MUE68_08675 [Bacteroidetes bacterium]|jgi:hypothetical protein|nr:hypothetical protein [Bacteroidota bacterium]